MDRPDLTINISRRALKIAGVICVSLILTFGTLSYAYGQFDQVSVRASVAGWFKVKQFDNEKIGLVTNMDVWVNGRQFVVCASPDQPLNTALVPSY